MTQTSTIAAIATGGAPGGIGVVRVSGPAALEAGRRVAQELPEAPTPRHAYFTSLRDREGRVLDEGLALYFAAPASFTGEDVVELHAHGAPRLLALLLDEVLAHPGVRLAEAGEFTRRAFLNGRLDLARAEAVADLVAAESEAQVRSAAAQLSGELSRRLAEVRQPLLALHADLEGALDFPDEASGADEGVSERLAEVRRAVDALVGDARAGALVRRGARVVLYGPVNAGKSTLFNRLVGAERALVDEEPGTTRDVLEAKLEVGGLAVTLVDTAGLRESPGRLEAMGIERAREALRGADLALLVAPPEATEEELAGWRAEVAEGLRVELWGKADLREVGGGAEAGDSAQMGTPVGVGLAPARLVENSGAQGRTPGRSSEHPAGTSKHPAGTSEHPAGTSEHPAGASEHPAAGPSGSRLRVSGRTGLGLDALRSVLVERLGGGVGQAVRVTSERHLDALRRAAEALERAEVASRLSTLEVVSGEVGLALAALADITGEDVSAELLDAIFARFCIGK
ncbi:MAG: tRNA uridine-5-carboxymethylaminomethyl(34) synthesis GTPase MnmE [Myxococcota bacterium]